MKLFLDENLPLSLVANLQSLGFEVEHVQTVGLRGASDNTIVTFAKEKKAILITKDLEFGNLLIYPSGSHFGLIVLRLPYHFTTNQISTALQLFLRKIKAEELVHSLVILEVGKYRIRRL